MTELEKVGCRGEFYDLQPDLYWHLTEPNSFLLNNAYLAEGLCRSLSVVARMPGLENAVTPYALRVMSDDKEQTWERTREATSADLPSRKGAIFLLDDEDAALEAMRLWFEPGTRILLKARIVQGSRVHRADSRWLDCFEDAWDDNAEKYWLGEMTTDPMPEILVDGAVYFPDWQEDPFGLVQPDI